MTRPDDTALADLPRPDLTGRVSLERVISTRRSVRDFAPGTLTPRQISQLCWAGQGITDPLEGLRAAPSAGALYPIDLYVVAADGVARYRPQQHQLKRYLRGDVRPALQQAALDQEMITGAPMCIVTAFAARQMTRKYGSRAERYCYIEAGHVAQNILLQATALGLGCVPIGAFEDRRVAEVLGLPKHQRPIYLLAVGYPSE